MTETVIIAQIESKLYNNPGFFEGVLGVTESFAHRTQLDLMLNWDNIVSFLKNYTFRITAVSPEGELIPNYKPFQTATDLMLAKFILNNYHL